MNVYGNHILCATVYFGSVGVHRYRHVGWIGSRHYWCICQYFGGELVAGVITHANLNLVLADLDNAASCLKDQSGLNAQYLSLISLCC